MNKIDPILRVFHVGGRGDCGPTTTLFRMGEDLSLTLFEASTESLSDSDNYIKSCKDNFGISLSIIQHCISNTIGKKKFYMNLEPGCSSLYPVHPYARHWTHVSKRKWGHMCIPRDTLEMDVTTIDELYTNHKIQMPNFLSIDAQGAEYDILEGSSNILKNGVVGIITEVEFSPIYDGQKLFSDQDSLLRKYQFNLCELFNAEYWFPGPAIDKGHLIVAEALFLRNYRYFVNKDKEPDMLLSNLSKLAIVAHCFNRTSCAFEIMEYIMNNWKNEWDIFIKTYNNKYLHSLMELYNNIKTQTKKVYEYCGNQTWKLG